MSQARSPFVHKGQVTTEDRTLQKRTTLLDTRLTTLSLSNKAEKYWKNHFYIDKQTEMCGFWDSIQVNEIITEYCHDLSKLIRHYDWRNLRIVKLNFEDCRNIGDKSLEALAKAFQKDIKNVKHLKLWFPRMNEYLKMAYSCPNITDAGLCALAASIERHMTGLKSLFLNFSGCELISDDGIDKLGLRISAHTGSLRNLELNFDGCKRITNKGLARLGSRLISHTILLHHLTLWFSDCPLITDEGLEAIAWFIRRGLKHLKTITIDFSYCTLVTFSGKQRLRQILKKVPKFYLY